MEGLIQFNSNTVSKMGQTINSHFIILFFALIATSTIKAQTIPLEIFIGAKNLQSTIVVAKPFMPNSKFRILSISSFEAYKESEYMNSSVMNTDVNYTIFKGISTGLDFTYNSIAGLSPTINMGFVKFGKVHQITISPAVIFSTTTSFRIIFNHSHKFRLNDQFNLYLSSNNLFTYTFNATHVRSYAKQRVGLDYHTFQFGFGFNMDWFGVNKDPRKNMGIFLRKEF